MTRFDPAADTSSPQFLAGKVRDIGVPLISAALVTTGASHVVVYNWTFLLGQSLMPAINALLLGSLLYRSLLVPRVIPALGLIGALLLITAVIATLFGGTGQYSSVAAHRRRRCHGPHLSGR